MQASAQLGISRSGTLLMCASFLTASLFCSLSREARAAQTTINSTNDGELDEHVNWNNSPKGSPGPDSPNCYQNGCKFMYAGRLADDYGNPVVGPSKFGVITFDVSSLAGQTINSVTLRLIQTFDPNAPLTVERTYDFTPRSGMQLAPTTNVYALNGSAIDFDETLDSWRSFTADGDPATDASRNAFLSSGKITQLGSLNNVVNPGGVNGAGAPVTFSSANLTSLVQGWISGTVPNRGLMLINPTTYTGAPAAPGDLIARYATHESNMVLNGGNPVFGGTQFPWDPPQLIITYGNTALTGDYNQNGFVDAADYTIWRDTLGSTSDLRANGDNTGASANVIDGADLLAWKNNFGSHNGAGSGDAFGMAAPEPSPLILLAVSIAALCTICRRGKSLQV